LAVSFSSVNNFEEWAVGGGRLAVSFSSVNNFEKWAVGGEFFFRRIISKSRRSAVGFSSEE